jgi:hypothetical protein
VKAALFGRERNPWSGGARWGIVSLSKGGSTVMTAFTAGEQNPSSSLVPFGAADERLVAVAKGFGRPVGPTDARGDSTPFKSV